MEVNIGCTGWGYEGWVGPFYPRGTKSSKFLNIYSSIFDITEVNSTFYATPQKQVVKKWFADTPAQFKFTAKIPQSITHERRMKNPSEGLEQFLEAMSSLKTKLLYCVIQLPPSLSFSEAMPNLEQLDSFDGFDYVIEGRHPSWFSDDATRYLSDKRICLVWSEVYNTKNPFPITSDFVYLRLIGDRAIPEKEFGNVVRDKTGDLKVWAERLRQVEDTISYAVIMANNHYEGFAPATANKMRTLLGLDKLTFLPDMQKKLDI